MWDSRVVGRGGHDEHKDTETRPSQRDPNEPWAYIPDRSGNVNTTPKGEFSDYGFDFAHFVEAKESAIGKFLDTEAAMYLYFIEHDRNIPLWVEATNWNARRYFAKGKTAGVFDEDAYVDLPDMHVPGDDRKKKIVCGRVWVETNYHELLMFIVEEMHIATGGFTTDREYFKKKSQGLFDAPCFQLRTGILLKTLF